MEARANVPDVETAAEAKAELEQRTMRSRATIGLVFGQRQENVTESSWLGMKGLFWGREWAGEVVSRHARQQPSSYGVAWARRTAQSRLLDGADRVGWCPAQGINRKSWYGDGKIIIG